MKIVEVDAEASIYNDDSIVVRMNLHELEDMIEAARNRAVSERSRYEVIEKFCGYAKSWSAAADAAKKEFYQKKKAKK